jgi:hypothetical protein
VKNGRLAAITISAVAGFALAGQMSVHLGIQHPLRHLRDQPAVDLAQVAIVLPSVKIALYRGSLRKILGQCPPMAVKV